jgi:hypothetical protein
MPRYAGWVLSLGPRALHLLSRVRCDDRTMPTCVPFLGPSDVSVVVERSRWPLRPWMGPVGTSPENPQGYEVDGGYTRDSWTLERTPSLR